MSYVDGLRERTKNVKSIVCMGMDPVIEKIPIKGETCQVIEEFYLDILKEMNKRNSYPAIIKPNIAYFEQYGFDGLNALKTIIYQYKSSGIPALLDALHQAGYRCVGPQARDGAIVYDTLGGTGDLPRGIRDAQAPGRYRLEETISPRFFSWANGPQALKPFLFISREPLWRSEQSTSGAIRFFEIKPSADLIAVIGGIMFLVIVIKAMWPQGNR